MATIFAEEEQRKLQQLKSIHKDLIDDEDDDIDFDDEEDEDDDDDDDDEEEEEEEEEEEQEPVSVEAMIRAYKDMTTKLFHRLSTEQVPLLVHGVSIKGNTKTLTSLIEGEIEGIKNATNLQELIEQVNFANARLQRFEIFDSVKITLGSGPPEIPGAANIVVEVEETKNPLGGLIGIISIPEFKSLSLEGLLTLKNLFGCGDIWDGSWTHAWDQTTVISIGVSLPRFKWLFAPLMAQISLLPQDWLKLSSYKDQLLGLSVGLISTRHHTLSYNFAWRSLVDPSQISSRSIRSQLGHSLLSSLKYRVEVDNRDSDVRPTRGHAFNSTLQVGGLGPDNQSLQFVRQDLDIRSAFPLGFANAALNFGVSAGVMFPWGRGFMNMASPLPERYFLGGCASRICNLGGPAALLGHKSWGISPTEPRRTAVGNSTDGTGTSPQRDSRVVDLAITAFADLSFDLPLRLFRDSGIHGHLFACAGNLSKLTEQDICSFSFGKYGESFRSSAGIGIVVPTKLFRMEVNYCYILKQLGHDQGKTGFQFSFSSPSSS